MAIEQQSPEAARLPDVPTELFIDGAWTAAQEGRTFEVIAPASEERLADVAAGAAADIDAAVQAARREVDDGAWSRLTGAERGRLIYALADLIERDAEILAVLEALDIGRPIFEPRVIDVPATIDVFRYFAGWADKIDGRNVAVGPHMGSPRHSYTIREPVGVVGAIVPWNVPLMIASWKMAPALAAGCSLVVKPPEDAPLSILHLTKLAAEAGFPPGVINVVPGLGEDAGAALSAHPGVDKLSFTGSPEVGRLVALAAAQNFTRVTLELGGKSPQIVLPDADVDAAIMGCAIGLFANQGEVCAAGSRIFVARNHYDQVVDGLAAAAGQVKLGDPLDESTTMGALINRDQHERVTGYVQRGRDDGARLVAGGGVPERNGYFVEPTIFADGTNDMTIAREEIFGPVGVVIPFDGVDEAVRLANETDYGLSAFVWTTNVSAAHTIAGKVKAGTVWINGFGIPDARLPWGGMKRSGLGRELGWSGVEACTEEKTVNVVL